MGAAEERGKLRTTEGEDGIHVARHPPAGDEVPERAERDRPADPVTNQRAAVLRLELVRVMPERVGSPRLSVDEAPRRLPGLDHALPA